MLMGGGDVEDTRGEDTGDVDCGEAGRPGAC